MLPIVGDTSFPFSNKEMIEEGWQSKCDLTRPLSNRNSYDKDLFVGTYQAFASHIGETTLKKHILEMFLLRCLHAPRSAI